MTGFSEEYLKKRKKAWNEGKKKPQIGLLEIMLDIQKMEDAQDAAEANYQKNHKRNDEKV